MTGQYAGNRNIKFKNRFIRYFSNITWSHVIQWLFNGVNFGLLLIRSLSIISQLFVTFSQNMRLLQCRTELCYVLECLFDNLTDKCRLMLTIEAMAICFEL